MLFYLIIWLICGGVFPPSFLILMLIKQANKKQSKSKLNTNICGNKNIHFKTGCIKSILRSSSVELDFEVWSLGKNNEWFSDLGSASSCKPKNVGTDFEHEKYKFFRGTGILASFLLTDLVLLSFCLSFMFFLLFLLWCFLGRRFVIYVLWYNKNNVPEEEEKKKKKTFETVWCRGIIRFFWRNLCYINLLTHKLLIWKLTTQFEEITWTRFAYFLWDTTQFS